MANLFYILGKQLGQEKALPNMRKLRMLVYIVTVTQEIIDLVLASNFKDIEDGIQYYCAIEAGINVLVTRNTKDFVGKNISVMNGDAFIASLNISW